MAHFKARPADLFATPLEHTVPITECDPFVNPSALIESYLFDLIFDPVEGKLGILFGLVGALCVPPCGNVGFLVCSNVVEFGWAARGRDRPPAGHFWTVLDAAFITRDMAPQVVIPPLLGWRPRFQNTSTTFYRYRLLLNPNSALIVSFSDAKYLVGRQYVAVEDTGTRFSVSKATSWFAASYWPQ